MTVARCTHAAPAPQEFEELRQNNPDGIDKEDRAFSQLWLIPRKGNVEPPPAEEVPDPTKEAATPVERVVKPVPRTASLTVELELMRLKRFRRPNAALVTLAYPAYSQKFNAPAYTGFGAGPLPLTPRVCWPRASDALFVTRRICVRAQDPRRGTAASVSDTDQRQPGAVQPGDDLAR
jgi:hypothetical protein